MFLDTLVDRIVPGFPGAEKETLFREWGYEDPLAVAAEPFHVWVIQGPKAIAAELPLAEAGLDVIWTDDLKPYRTRKVRILNGGHTASVLAAYLAGLDTVEEMTKDPQISAFLRRVLLDEIVPQVPLPDAERRAYAATILERFANPFIRHELLSIALNSVSKWVVRVLPTVEDWVKDGKPAPDGLAFSLAALLWFYRGAARGRRRLRPSRPRRLPDPRRRPCARHHGRGLGRRRARRRARDRPAPARRTEALGQGPDHGRRSLRQGRDGDRRDRGRSASAARSTASASPPRNAALARKPRNERNFSHSSRPPRLRHSYFVPCLSG